MAEYKGKLLKGVFTRAAKCLMNDKQTSVEDMVTTDGSHNLTAGSTITVASTLSYFKIGKLVVVTLGGVSDSFGASDAIIATDLPKMNIFVVGTVQNDADATKTALVYGVSGTQILRFASHSANTVYYGQVVYYTD